MHIALVNQWYPPETGGGGVAMHNYYFAQACARLGHHVTIIAQRPKPATPALRVEGNITILRVTSPDFYRARRLPLLGRQYRVVQGLLYSWQVCRALKMRHRELPVDVAEFAEVNAEGFFWNGSMSKRLVVRCHTPAWVLDRYYTRVESPYDANLLGWAEKRVIRRAHLITAPSQDLANVISADCGLPVARIHPIANALDVDQFKPDPSVPKADTLTALFVGRLERQKGIDALVKAIPIVCAQFPNIRFTIVGGSRPRPGGGLYSDYIKTELAAQIAAGQVALCGFVPDEQLAGLYQRSHINLVPSVLYESFSFTAAQGMAFGLPVVASRIGGVPETLGFGECGVLVEPDNPDELAAGILTLARDPALRERMGAAGRARAVSTFTADVVARATIAYYESALAS